MTIKTRLSGFLCAAAILCTVSACTPTPRVHGNLIEDFRLENIKVGESNQRDVVQILGTPSSVSTFDDSTWYYIGERTKQTAFFQPEVQKRRILVMNFDDEGTLTAMNDVDESAGQDIDIIRRETESSGRRFTVIQEFVGNLGRFNN